MKPEYDFSRGERGKFFRRAARLILPDSGRGSTGTKPDYVFPDAAERVPDEVRNGLEKLATTVNSSPRCLRFVEKSVRSRWQHLLHEWELEEDIPLLVRKASKERGSVVIHESGRKLVRCDNSPAQWGCWLAVAGRTPSIAQVREWFERDEIPVAMAFEREERKKAQYRCPLGKYSVNERGWKLCHVEPVGMRVRVPLQRIPIEQVHAAFRNLLDPANYFLLAKSLGGLGEVQAFQQGVLRSGAGTDKRTVRPRDQGNRSARRLH